MVLGYDEERPSREDYEDFMHRLVDGLSDEWFEGISLIGYGSYSRKDKTRDIKYGRSDVDALLVFPYDVVIDKETFHEAGIVLNAALNNKSVPFQVTPTDLRTMQDGRFDTYDPNFEKYFKEDSIVVLGPDYRNEFKYELPTMSDQNQLRFNLRKARQGLLFFEYYKKNGKYIKLLEKFVKSLDAASRASKQVLGMIDGKLRVSRFSALEELSQVFPDLDISPLQKIKRLYNNLEELDALYRNPDEIHNVWNNSVSFFEELIKSYINLKII